MMITQVRDEISRAREALRGDVRPAAPSRAGFDPVAALAAVASGVLVVAPDWRIVFGNPAAAAWLGMSTREIEGADARSLVPSLVVEHDGALATLRDGIARNYRAEVVGAGGVAPLQVRVSRDATQHLIFELTPARSLAGAFDDLPAGAERAGPGAWPADGRHEENAALRVLARQMAELADSSALLHVLCQAAWAQCGGSGAAVAITAAGTGTLAVGVGALAGAVGIRFPLEGSVAAEAIEARIPIADPDFGTSGRPLSGALRRLGVGPVLVAPLVAHDEVLGVIAVVRPASSAAFAAREVNRLQVIADHASLAIWKAQLLEQAQAADAAKGRFLATMSHELRTPLTALQGYGELLADQVIGPLSDSQLDVLDRMRSVTHHLSTMIEEILAFTSLEAGHEDVRPSEFLAADLVTAVAVVVEPLARQKGLRVETTLPAEPLRVSSDIDKLRQILVNLASNAVKFTEQGTVHIGAERDAEGCARFFVRDTGVGIAADDVERLFHPFTQLDAGLTRRHGGTGLGLYISHRLAALLGGRLEVETMPGQGSTFTVVLGDYQ